MDEFNPEKWASFVRFPAFNRDWQRLGLDEDDLRSLELMILAAPTRPPVIQGTGGLRKIRFGGRKSARGKSSAYRICYAYFPEFGTIALAIVFGKTEKADLNQADRRAIATIIEAYRKELQTAFGRRRSRDLN